MFFRDLNYGHVKLDTMDGAKKAAQTGRTACLFKLRNERNFKKNQNARQLSQCLSASLLSLTMSYLKRKYARNILIV